MCQDPDRPSLESHHLRFFCVGFRCGNDVAICINLYWRGCIIHFRKYGLPYGLSVSLCTLHLMVTHFDATLGTGGWLDLTQQGLSPCKTYKTSWRSSVKSYRIIELLQPVSIIFMCWWPCYAFILLRSPAISFITLSSSLKVKSPIFINLPL